MARLLMKLQRSSRIDHGPATQHERLLGATPHIASIFFPVIGPAIAVFALAPYPFAQRQAKSSLRGDLLLMAITVSVMVLSLSASLVSAVHAIQNGMSFDWAGMLIKSLAVWLLLALFGFINTVTSIIAAVRAFQTQVTQN